MNAQLGTVIWSTVIWSTLVRSTVNRNTVNRNTVSRNTVSRDIEHADSSDRTRGAFAPASSGRGRRGVAVALLVTIALALIPLGGVAAAQDEEVDTAGFPRRGAIQGNRVNIRSGPSTNHVSFAQLADRTAVALTGRRGEWLRFALPPSVPVWISEKYVSPNADGSLRVDGNRVRVRAQPNTKQNPIGLLETGARLRPTGRRDATDTEYGPWLEVAAPLTADGWVHQDYVAVEAAIAPDSLARFYEGVPVPTASSGRGDLARGEARPASAGEGAGSAEPAGERPEFRLPAVGREPFIELYERIRAENAKPPIEWQFEPIAAELRGLATRSEDQIVVDTANEWLAIIEDYWVPTQRRMVALEREKEAARRAREAAEAKEREIEKRPGERIARREKDFLAVGWVDLLGKYRKADGTHRLLKGNQLVFYLRSETLNLDDYVNKRVGISGVIQEQPPSAGAQLILVTGIQVLSD